MSLFCPGRRVPDDSNDAVDPLYEDDDLCEYGRMLKRLLMRMDERVSDL